MITTLENICRLADKFYHEQVAHAFIYDSDKENIYNLLNVIIERAIFIKEDKDIFRNYKELKIACGLLLFYCKMAFLYPGQVLKIRPYLCEMYKLIDKIGGRNV